VFVDLMGAGYKVFGVNPKGYKILCFILFYFYFYFIFVVHLLGGVVAQQKLSTSIENCLKENKLDTETGMQKKNKTNKNNKF
jgi:hypothetical protein